MNSPVSDEYNYWSYKLPD